MPESVSDILKSKAVIWYAPTGTARPDETTVAAGGSWTNWTKLGYTKEPLSVLYEFSEHETMVEQVLGPVNRWKTDEHVTLETVLAEATALNLELASGGDGTTLDTTAAGASQDAYEELDIGNNPLLTKWAVGVEGIKYDEDDGALPVRIFLDNCTINLNGELSFSQKDDDYTGIPVQIKGLANASGEMFTWQRVTAAATS